MSLSLKLLENMKKLVTLLTTLLNQKIDLLENSINPKMKVNMVIGQNLSFYVFN